MTLSAAEVEEFYEGFSNATLWPLYHDVVAKPEFHREWWDSYVRVNQRFAEQAAQGCSGERDRVGARLPAPARPADAARAAAATCGSASSCTSRSRPPSCSSSCRGDGRSSRACWAPTWSASSSPARPRTSCAWSDSGSATRPTVTWSTCPTARTVRAAAFPISIDSGGLRGAGSLRGGREAGGRDPRGAGQPPQGVPWRGPARLHQGHLRPAARVRRADRGRQAGRRGRRVRPGRDAVARGGRAVPDPPRRHRPAGRPDQRRPGPDRPSGDQLPARVVPPGGDGRAAIGAPTSWWSRRTATA